jgi:hypothetical protein
MPRRSSDFLVHDLAVKNDKIVRLRCRLADKSTTTERTWRCTSGSIHRLLRERTREPGELAIYADKAPVGLVGHAIAIRALVGGVSRPSVKS